MALEPIEWTILGIILGAIGVALTVIIAILQQLLQNSQKNLTSDVNKIINEEKLVSLHTKNTIAREIVKNAQQISKEHIDDLYHILFDQYPPEKLEKKDSLVLIRLINLYYNKSLTHGGFTTDLTYFTTSVMQSFKSEIIELFMEYIRIDRKYKMPTEKSIYEDEKNDFKQIEKDFMYNNHNFTINSLYNTMIDRTIQLIKLKEVISKDCLKELNDENNKSYVENKNDIKFFEECKKVYEKDGEYKKLFDLSIRLTTSKIDNIKNHYDKSIDEKDDFLKRWKKLSEAIKQKESEATKKNSRGFYVTTVNMELIGQLCDIYNKFLDDEKI